MYMAEMASLKAEFTVYHDNLNIKWSGYNDSLPTFVIETMKRIRAIDMSQ